MEIRPTRSEPMALPFFQNGMGSPSMWLLQPRRSTLVSLPEMEIPIEERDAAEVTHFQGKPIAPKGVKAFNPAFDVTPHPSSRPSLRRKESFGSLSEKNLRKRFELGTPKGRMRNPIITLLTDFGTKDHYVASMKGVILGINPGAPSSISTHQVKPQDIEEGAFILANAYSYFPKGNDPSRCGGSGGRGAKKTHSSCDPELLFRRS